MNKEIVEISDSEYEQIIKLWELSVRATHNFLLEEDIVYYKSTANRCLNSVNLYAVKDSRNKILAFMGTSEDKIEMLFVSPNEMRKGVGTLLIKYAVNTLKIKKVDVNEQNEQAAKFYQKMGFYVINRSERDNEGKPYPILHLALKEQ
ncbi:MAG: GNAT family N-acetyltransferase [Prevotellaceae bacterium]|jgi:putative acetyltransferase|nr:GNAT family N-acetyltransferase [Prevotellaceae bacterium]